MSGSEGRTVMNILLMWQFDKEISLHRIKDINLVLAIYSLHVHLTYECLFDERLVHRSNG